MSLFKRDLARCGKSVIIETRAEKIINGQSSEIFTLFGGGAVNAIIKTLGGISVFDDTNTERIATHKLLLEYIDGVTSEMWVRFSGRRIKILSVENCCEDNSILILMCTSRGDDSKIVNSG